MSKFCRFLQEIESRHGTGIKSYGVKELLDAGIPVPRGFALSIDAYQLFISHNQLQPIIGKLVGADWRDIDLLKSLSEEIQQNIVAGEFPGELKTSIGACVDELYEKSGGHNNMLVVRSSSNFEDMEGLSFAGLYDSFLNVERADVYDKIRLCYASLFSVRSLTYLLKNNIYLHEIGMGVLVQELVNATSAGTIFSCDIRSGFDGCYQVEGVWGYGVGVVSGKITPNSWMVYKATGKVIEHEIGNTDKMYAAHESGGLELVTTPAEKYGSFCLSDDEVEELVKYMRILEDIRQTSLDVEWVRSVRGELFLVQVRPLTVPKDEFFVKYHMDAGSQQPPVLKGFPITQKAVSGKVRKIREDQWQSGLTKEHILVAKYLDVDDYPYLLQVGGIVVEGGGFTSHISIILREQNIPAIFGAQGAYSLLETEQVITLLCSQDQGAVYDGKIRLRKEVVDISLIKKPWHKVHVVTSTFRNLDHYLQLPLEGIGLVRLEFVINESIGIHPLALIDYDKGIHKSPELKLKIEERTRGYASKRQFYIDRLAEKMCAFASRCPNKIVNIRFPDFITDDYLTLIGGEFYEQYTESNPMLGWRGTSRLIDNDYTAAFELDCKAFRKAADLMGFDNIRILVPFCRTPDEGRKIRSIIKAHGPSEINVGMMVEIPSNVMLADQFAEIFDFFLVGPMDLTQLTYGADRTSPKLSKFQNETEAVKEMVKYFFSNLNGYNKEVFIGGWPLFQYAKEYHQLKGENELKLVELPDRLLELFDQVNNLESNLKYTSNENLV